MLDEKKKEINEENVVIGYDLLKYLFEFLFKDYVKDNPILSGYF